MTVEPFIIALTIVATVLVVGVITSLMKEGSLSGKITDASINSKLDSAEEKSNSIIHAALKQARLLLVRAELTGIKEVAQTKQDTRQLEEVFQSHIAGLITQSEKHLEKTTEAIEHHYIDLFQKTELDIKKQIADNEQRILNQLDLTVEESQKLFRTHSEITKTHIEQQINNQMQEVTKTLEAYKTKRMEAIEAHITELVIETVKRTLDKSLKPEEHGDLVIRALTEAREDGFFN